MILSELTNTRISIGDGAVIITVFGFGLVLTKVDSFGYQQCNKMRKTENRQVFITAPMWFNKHVWNIGGSMGEEE